MFAPLRASRRTKGSSTYTRTYIHVALSNGVVGLAEAGRAALGHGHGVGEEETIAQGRRSLI